MFKVSSIIIISLLVSSYAMASHEVGGYYNDGGTYVSPHMSMDPGEAESSGYSYHDNVVYRR